MNCFYKRTLALCLAVLLAMSFVGCGQGKKGETTTGILIEKDPLYSAEAQSLAEETLYALITYAYRAALTDNIPQKVEARLADYAHRVAEIFAKEPIPEAQYQSVMEMLAQGGPAVIDECLAVKAGEAVDCERTRTLYLDLTYAYGAERVSNILYDFCLFLYDAHYERAMEKFEEYQYPWFKEDADALAAQKQVFAGGIKKESFSALLRFTTAMAELLSINPEGLADSFSDAEVLEIVHHLDVSQIDITADAWDLLLSYVPRGKDGSYTAKLAAVFEESGDRSRLAAVMNDAVTLSASVLKKLLPEDIAALREGEREVLINSIFSRFDEEDWSLFASLTSIPLANGQYSALAIEQYGSQAYLSYIASMKTVSLAELRAAIGSAEFYQTLTDYLAALCPAISYEVNA